MSLTTLNLELPTLAEISRERDARAAKRARIQFRREARRSFKAATVNRLNRDWNTVSTSTRYETYRNLRRLRARARELARNSDHFKKFLSMVRNNVAGPNGMTIQVNGPNQEQNTAIEQAFAAWGHKQTASLSGRVSWVMALRRLCTTLARDGEVLVREKYGTNRFGYSLKFISVNWLDEMHNETLPNGNRVVMGVEIDNNEKPVNYWLTPPANEYAAGFTPDIRKRTPVPADEIHHIFLPDDENTDDDTQTRGIPWAHTAMLRLHNLESYEEAALFAARAGASKMGFFTPPDDADETSGEDEDEEKDEKPIIDHFEPGSFWETPPGYTFTPFDPKYPDNAHDPFVKSMLRSAASGLDVSYVSLANDLEGVNFSSIRAGLVEEREIWKALQNFVIESFCRPVFLNWLREAILEGAVPVRPREVPLLQEPTFKPRRWSWVDPLKDIQAKRLAIEAGLDTITDTLAEQDGSDTLEDVFKKRANELDLAKDLKIPLAAGAGSVPPETDDQEDDKPPPKKQTKKGK